MITKSSIDKLLEMPDDRLISMLKLLLGSIGINMQDKKFDSKSVSKIRALLGEINDRDIERITYLSDIYKKGGHR